jgi:SAM-dependent methyltransferase
MVQLQMRSNSFDDILSPMPQSDIWAYYQNEAMDNFSGAKKRLDYLVKFAHRAKFNYSTLLNIGCGDGYLERTALAAGWKVLSLDPDQRAVNRLAEQGIEAHCGVIESLPLQDESVDVVTCSEVLEHLTADQMNAGLAEIKRVLKPKGLLLGTTPYCETLNDNKFVCIHCGVRSHRWGHHQSFDEVKMQSGLGQFFSVLKVGPKYFPNWQTNWKGKLFNLALLTLSMMGSSGKSSNLFFAAVKNKPTIGEGS